MKDFLDPEEQDYLLRLARRTIEGYLRTGKHFRPKAESNKLAEKRGAFVTLKVDGQLRGCIGYPVPTKSLVDTVTEMALAAATQDYRFLPLQVEELDRLKIEISVLTLPRPIQDAREVEVGRHGIIVTKGMDRGLLLPQVPTEYGWDRETYLRHGCLKAGLDEDEWRKGAKIEVFEAQVFSES
jgi:AmmeMemoRadiSam system protein A